MIRWSKKKTTRLIKTTDVKTRVNHHSSVFIKQELNKISSSIQNKTIVKAKYAEKTMQKTRISSSFDVDTNLSWLQVGKIEVAKMVISKSFSLNELQLLLQERSVPHYVQGAEEVKSTFLCHY